ncbi:MAG: FAD-binding protein [Clostridia bacterium]|nr:FAD-binding protein [Clostridia bacterium]
MKDLSRRSFLKGALAGTAGVALTGIAGMGIAEAAAIYTPGTYSATAQGIGTVLVTMTFSETAITDVVLDVSGETAGYGRDAAEALKAALMNAQSAEIDAVSGSTLTSKAVMEAADKCIKQAKGEIPVEVIETKAEENAPADWLGAEPQIAEEEIAETWNTDFLIVGAGNGGMAAAAYAAKQGYDFRVIEKGTTMARVRGWYGAIDSKDAAAVGEPPVDRAALRRELKRYASGKANMAAFNTWINESAAMHDFVSECYAKYVPDAKVTVTTGEEAVWPHAEESGFFFPVCEHTWGFGADRQKMFEQMVNEAGHPIDFNTALVKLEKNAEGRVTGVIAKNTESGAYIRINAAKGVLLAAGGYSSNVKMMEQLNPLAVAVTTSNVGWPTNTGDGIKAAVWAGAALQAEAAPMLFDRGIVPAGVDAGYVTTSTGDKVFPSEDGQFGLGSQPFLKVNRNGQRFTDESGTYDHMCFAAYNQPGHVYASIFDANMPEDVVRFHTLGCSAGTRKNPQGTLDSFMKKVDEGKAYVADTLEELADKMGFAGEAKENFLATCARYNELYDMQEDVDFGKQAYRLSALRKAPFYGFFMGACILCTEQGILVNEKAQALDTAGKPMDGLYVTGDMSGGFFVDNYPCLMPGIAMGRTMTFALKAVKVAMGEE